MTDISYPLSIRPFLLSVNSRQQTASFTTTESTSGKLYFEKIAQDQSAYMNVTLKFTQNKAMIFQSQFRNTIKNGLLPFKIDLCTAWGVVNYLCRFMPDSLLNATKETPLIEINSFVLYQCRKDS